MKNFCRKNGKIFKRSTIGFGEPFDEEDAKSRPKEPIGWTTARLLGCDKYRDILFDTTEFRYFFLNESDKFILIASSGFWEVMTKEECVEFLLR